MISSNGIALRNMAWARGAKPRWGASPSSAMNAANGTTYGIHGCRRIREFTASQGYGADLSPEVSMSEGRTVGESERSWRLPPTVRLSDPPTTCRRQNVYDTFVKIVRPSFGTPTNVA